ncbi:MAG: transglutaminase family protein [Desulfofustis sp.]|nr:transglutaminase family protein [Desulfofustis sp.]
MKYAITHTTAYKYSEPASLSQNELFLYPRTTPYQLVENSSLSILPEPQYRHRRTDFFGNTVEVFMVQHPHDELVVRAHSVVQTSVQTVPDQSATAPWEDVAKRLASHAHQADFDAVPFLFASPLITVGPQTQSYARISFTPGRPVLAAALDLMRRIYDEFSYDKTASTIDTTVVQILENRKGVCQDFAHLTISCLRSLGLAARYVSGYLETLPTPGKPKLIGSDASHAWVALFIPDFGWVDFDPTNNLVIGERHITLAWGRDYGDVAPVKGVVMGGGQHRLTVNVDVAAQTS